MAIQTTTIAITGTATKQVVAVDDIRRRYITVYSHTGSCEVSIGDGVHATMAMILAQGNLLQFERINGSKINYTGVGTELHITTGTGANTVLTFDKAVLTYGGYTLFFNPITNL